MRKCFVYIEATGHDTLFSLYSSITTSEVTKNTLKKLEF